MTVAMLLVFVVPFWTAVSTIVEYQDDIQELGQITEGRHAADAAHLGRELASRRTEDRRDMERNTPRRRRKRSRPSSRLTSVRA